MSYTTSGATALYAPRLAREGGLDVPIIGLTSSLQTARKLAIVWGLHCVHTADVQQLHRHGAEGDAASRAPKAFAKKGERVAGVITAGVPFGTPGATNVLRIAWVDS